jgi:hypothetical protein
VVWRGRKRGRRRRKRRGRGRRRGRRRRRGEEESKKERNKTIPVSQMHVPDLATDQESAVLVTHTHTW